MAQPRASLVKSSRARQFAKLLIEMPTERQAMSRFLTNAGGHDPDRLSQLQQVYDWLAPTVADQKRLALAILAAPPERVTFEQILEGILKDLELAAHRDPGATVGGSNK